MLKASYLATGCPHDTAGKGHTDTVLRNLSHQIYEAGLAALKRRCRMCRSKTLSTQDSLTVSIVDIAFINSVIEGIKPAKRSCIGDRTVSTKHATRRAKKLEMFQHSARTAIVDMRFLQYLIGSSG